VVSQLEVHELLPWTRDEMLLRAWNLALEDITEEVETRLAELLPSLIEAGYVDEKPWGDAESGLSGQVPAGR
jgi:hypothetical protein